MKKSIKEEKLSKESTIYNLFEEYFKDYKPNPHIRLYMGKESFEYWKKVMEEDFKKHNKI